MAESRKTFGQTKGGGGGPAANPTPAVTCRTRIVGLLRSGS
jgi:hypothetical protein